jgi:DNA polymerase-3 subunit alpha
MDVLPGNRAQKIADLEKIIDLAHVSKEEEKTGQMGLFALIDQPTTESVSNGYTFAPRADFSDKEKLEKEKEVVGIYLSSHPLKSYPAIAWIEHLTFNQALEKIKEVTSLKEPMVTCLGLLQSHRVISTKKGDKMAFAQFEDAAGHGEVVIFPQLFAKVESLLGQYNVFVIKGALDITSSTKCKIKANELIPLETIFEQAKDMIMTVTLPSMVDESLLQAIKNAVQPGNISFNVAFKENNQLLMLVATQKVTCSQDFCQALAQQRCEIRIVIGNKRD